jgi:hypothetical protein
MFAACKDLKARYSHSHEELLTALYSVKEALKSNPFFRLEFSNCDPSAFVKPRYLVLKLVYVYIVCRHSRRP